MTATTVALIAIGVVLVALIWAVVQLILQNGRILTRLDELERRLDRVSTERLQDEAQRGDGLPLGTLGTEFELPGLDGALRRFSDMAGHPLVLIFFDPDSVECQAILPDLAGLLNGRSNDQPTPVLISTGAPERTREVLGTYEIDALTLMQEHDELAALFQVKGTPSAYLISEQLRTATPLSLGGDGVLRLLEIQAGDVDRAASVKLPSDADQTTPYAPATEPRGPLRQGEIAPEFCLPLLNGGEVSLSQYRGRRLLLVFVDPECQPCLDLLPQLQRVAAAHSDEREVLLISRRAAEINRQMARVREISIPIALQEYWQISDLYGRRAVPSGCVIDEAGVLLTDLLTGKSHLDPIVTVPLHD
jgi:peroxiredoxin